MSRLRLRVLGSAAGGGVPQWNCRCRVCSLAWAGDGRVRRRTQSSIAVSSDGTSWAPVNRIECEAGMPFMLVPGIEAEIFSVPGKTALYLERGEVEIGAEGEATSGVALRAGGETAFYIPGCARLTPALRARLSGAAV